MTERQVIGIVSRNQLEIQHAVEMVADTAKSASAACSLQPVLTTCARAVVSRRALSARVQLCIYDKMSRSRDGGGPKGLYTKQTPTSRFPERSRAIAILGAGCR